MLVYCFSTARTTLTNVVITTIQPATTVIIDGSHGIVNVLPVIAKPTARDTRTPVSHATKLKRPLTFFPI